MKILMVHNFYRQRGGECTIFESERRMLSAAGHEIITYCRNSDEIEDGGLWKRAGLALRTIWAWDSYRELRTLLAREAPDVAHFTNTFPLVSPSAYYACRAERVPVVQSIHNYRLLCPAATLWREGAPCEECIEHSLWRSVRYACYRRSRAATAVLATMLAVHRRLGTWSRRVDRYIALTQFARAKLASGALPSERIVVKPNFTEAGSEQRTGPGNYALYSGRLAAEKGLHTLLDAWQRLEPLIPLWIAGDGPLRAELDHRVTSEKIEPVRLLGSLAHNELLGMLRGARFLVFPSQWYEGMPMAILEAFACGVPPIASRLGGMQEMIDEGRTGLLFTPNDPGDLAEKIAWACGHEAEVAQLGRAARIEYESNYTEATNSALLLDVYRDAIDSRKTANPR